MHAADYVVHLICKFTCMFFSLYITYSCFDCKQQTWCRAADKALLLQDEEGFFHLRRQSLLFRKKVTAFTIVETRGMVGTGTVEGVAALSYKH